LQDYHTVRATGALPSRCWPPGLDRQEGTRSTGPRLRSAHARRDLGHGTVSRPGRRRAGPGGRLEPVEVTDARTDWGLPAARPWHGSTGFSAARNEPLLWSILVVNRRLQDPGGVVFPGGARGTRTPDPLLANRRQHVHSSTSVQVTVLGRAPASVQIRAGCCTFPLYSPAGSAAVQERCGTSCRVSRFPPSATRMDRRPEVACHGFDLTLLHVMHVIFLVISATLDGLSRL
jgi:hypothetical protein